MADLTTTVDGRTLKLTNLGRRQIGHGSP